MMMTIESKNEKEDDIGNDAEAVEDDDGGVFLVADVLLWRF